MDGAASTTPPIIDRLREPECRELTVFPDGTVWWRDQAGTTREQLELLRYAAWWAEVTDKPSTIEFEGSRFAGEVIDTLDGPAVRWRRTCDAMSDLRRLQQVGEMLPEIRVSVESSIAVRESLVMSTPNDRYGGTLLAAIVKAWDAVGVAWVLPARPSVAALEDALRLRPDVIVVEHPGPRVWARLAETTVPLLLRFQAPSADKVVRRLVAWTARSQGVSLEVAAETVAGRLDFVLEERLDGSGRGLWRLASGGPLRVEFVAGTRAPLAAHRASTGVRDLDPVHSTASTNPSLPRIKRPPNLENRPSSQLFAEMQSPTRTISTSASTPDLGSSDGLAESEAASEERAPSEARRTRDLAAAELAPSDLADDAADPTDDFDRTRELAEPPPREGPTD